MQIKKYLLGSAAALLLFSGLAAASPKIIYIPLDNRPVNLEYTVDTAKAAGYPLTVPPEKYLSNHKSVGDNEGLWEWLETEAPHAEAAVIATDSLNYGGLVASRKHHHLEKYLRGKIVRLDTLHKIILALRSTRSVQSCGRPVKVWPLLNPPIMRHMGPRSSVFPNWRTRRTWKALRKQKSGKKPADPFHSGK